MFVCKIDSLAIIFWWISTQTDSAVGDYSEKQSWAVSL